MGRISFAEFKELPKRDVNKQKLEKGKKYYIQDTTRKNAKLITVWKGIFIQKNGEWNEFSDVEIVVNPLFDQGGNPHSFNNKKGNKFSEVIDFEPTEFEINNKNKTIHELNEFINEKRVEPHDITPNISFMGKDYRKAKTRFYNNTHTFKKPSSTKINRITSSSKRTSSPSTKINRITSSSKRTSSPSTKINRTTSSSNSKKGGRRYSRKRRNLSR
jgi:hypothetical protein